MAAVPGTALRNCRKLKRADRHNSSPMLDAIAKWRPKLSDRPDWKHPCHLRGWIPQLRNYNPDHRPVGFISHTRATKATFDTLACHFFGIQLYPAKHVLPAQLRFRPDPVINACGITTY